MHHGIVLFYFLSSTNTAYENAHTEMKICLSEIADCNFFSQFSIFYLDTFYL